MLLRSIVLAVVCITMSLTSVCVPAQAAASPDAVLSLMEKAADWQIGQLSGSAPVGWEHGAFYAGLMALTKISANAKYADAMVSVGEKNKWALGKRPFHADDHCVGQAYLEIYAQRKDQKMLQPTRAGMDELVKHLASEEKLTWDWCDALFMAPATLAQLSAATGDRKYLDAMDKQWWECTDALYDNNEHLFYRDARFLGQKTPNGKKIFWSRGNGWVLAGLARVLQAMPAGYPTRSRYVAQYRDMAKSAAALQGADGLWRPSLLDPDEVPIGETSGTGFFCYAIAWGINNGLLDAGQYRPVVDRAWKALVSSVNSDGRLGYVQPVGDRPGQLSAASTQPYGVGALLLAGSEVYRLVNKNTPAVSTNPMDSLDQVIRQYREFCLSPLPSSAEQACKFAASLREDGSWADIDYKSQQRAAWVTSAHIARITNMTYALFAPKATPEQLATIESAIHKSLAYWAAHDFQCPNWWHNEIGVPKSLGTIALLLGDRLRPSEFDYITGKALPRARIGMTGQNRVWLAGITLMNALLRRDEPKLAEAASVIFSEVVITDQEGIQPDYSFHQHGPQIQFGNYGGAFLSDQQQWAMVLRDTPWALPTPKLKILCDYLMEGQNWVVWRGAMDISSCGRQLAPSTPRGKGTSVTRQSARMAEIDKANAKAYQAAIKRNQPNAANDLIGTKFFWRSDYMIDRSKDICYTLKMCSKRVIGTESINSENLSGYYLGDGAMYIYRAGNEYEEILPAWDWRRIPGVTCPQGTGPMPTFGGSGNYRLDSDFVGGVTDGTNACAVLDYRRDGVSAKKAWFFADDQVVCLGSGIRTESRVTAPIATSINQCLLRGEVRVGDTKSGIVLPTGTRVIDSPKYIDHDQMRYTFLQPQKVTVSNQPQTGNWAKVFKMDTTPKSDVTLDVFSLWIDHGANPDGASYAYSISPIRTRSQSPEVLANTEQMQAVKIGKLVEAVFYAPGSLTYAPNSALKVESPCVVVLDLSKKSPSLTVADPMHTLESISLELNGQRHNVPLPRGAHAGRGVSVDLSKQ